MNREPQPSVCQFCGAEIKLTDDEWAIQSPYGTLPGHVCAKCAPDTVSGANRKKGYMMFVSRRAMKPNAPALPPQRSGGRQQQVVGNSESGNT